MTKAAAHVLLGVFELPGAAEILRGVLDAIGMGPPLRAATDRLIVGARFIVVSSLDGGRVWRPADERALCILLGALCVRAGRDGDVKIESAVDAETRPLLQGWIERLKAPLQ